MRSTTYHDVHRKHIVHYVFWVHYVYVVHRVDECKPSYRITARSPAPGSYRLRAAYTALSSVSFQ